MVTLDGGGQLVRARVLASGHLEKCRASASISLLAILFAICAFGERRS